VGRNTGAAALIVSLLGGTLACLAGCAAVAGLDSIEECTTCLEGGASQDGTVGADVGADATSGGDASSDTSTGDSAPNEVGPGRDAGDAAPQDGAPGDAPGDGSGQGDAPGDAKPVDAQGDSADASGPCNPSTCVGGCCQGIDCVAGTQDNACGLTGGTCQNCVTLGDTCVGGACQAPSPNCPTTCSGCCDTNNACHATKTPQYCPTAEGGVFKAGLPCEDCVAEGYPYCILDIVAYLCSPVP